MDTAPRASAANTIPRSVRELQRRLSIRLADRLVRVRLFGSRARGDAHEDSDVDVLILVRSLSHAEKVDAIGIGAEVSLETGDTLSLLPMTPEAYEELRRLEVRLARDIDREGIDA